MAYNEEKLTRLKALKQLAQRMESDFATKEQLTSAINAKLASTYKAGGTVAFASLPALNEANLGLVVNVSDAFVTTASFLEGAGSQYPAGTNVAVVKAGDTYQYDAMSGFVDLSGFVAKTDIASDSEVTAMLQEVFSVTA